MTDEVQKGLTVGNANDPVRMAMRLSRLRQSVGRAEGDRKAALEAEIAQITARLNEIKAALAATEA